MDKQMKGWAWLAVLVLAGCSHETLTNEQIIEQRDICAAAGMGAVVRYAYREQHRPMAVVCQPDMKTPPSPTKEPTK